MTPQAAVKAIQGAKRLTFLTGAGISTPSGIPDYRSLQGVYQGLEAPEYLLSHECMVAEPEKFYQFVRHLYHPKAMPNVIHRKIATLAKEKSVWVVSQNIDGLHRQAGSQQLVDFHGNLQQIYCRQCGQTVPVSAYLQSDRHQQCGGQLRPDIVLYGEGFREDILTQAVKAVEGAELILVVGTSFQVHPFCDLIHYRSAAAKIVAINRTPIKMAAPFQMVLADGVEVFKQL